MSANCFAFERTTHSAIGLMGLACRRPGPRENSIPNRSFGCPEYECRIWCQLDRCSNTYTTHGFNLLLFGGSTDVARFFASNPRELPKVKALLHTVRNQVVVRTNPLASTSLTTRNLLQNSSDQMRPNPPGQICCNHRGFFQKKQDNSQATHPKKRSPFFSSSPTPGNTEAEESDSELAGSDPLGPPRVPGDYFFLLWSIFSRVPNPPKEG